MHPVDPLALDGADAAVGRIESTLHRLADENSKTKRGFRLIVAGLVVCQALLLWLVAMYLGNDAGRKGSATHFSESLLQSSWEGDLHRRLKDEKKKKKDKCKNACCGNRVQVIQFEKEYAGIQIGFISAIAADEAWRDVTINSADLRVDGIDNELGIHENFLMKTSAVEKQNKLDSHGNIDQVIYSGVYIDGERERGTYRVECPGHPKVDEVCTVYNESRGEVPEQSCCIL